MKREKRVVHSSLGCNFPTVVWLVWTGSEGWEREGEGLKDGESITKEQFIILSSGRRERKDFSVEYGKERGRRGGRYSRDRNRPISFPT